MSAEALTWAFRQSGHTFNDEWHAIKPNERFLLVALADRANHEGTCWPGYKDLAYRTGYTPRRVMQLIARLVKSGLVEKIERSGQRGRQTSNLYVLHFERGVAFAEVGRRVDRVARYNASLPREPMVAEPGEACGQPCGQPVDNSQEHSTKFHPSLDTEIGTDLDDM